MNIWLLSFESIYTRKVGGLAEVPPRLGLALKNKGHEVKIIVPSHGFAVKEDNKSKLEELYRIDTSLGEIAVYKYSEPPVDHIIISGGILEDTEVYSPTHIYEKIYLWSIGVRTYAEKMLIEGNKPDIIHGNDWHSVPPILALKMIYDLIGEERTVKYIYHIHLLSKAHYDINHLAVRIGLNLEKEIHGIYGWRTLREYYDLSRGYADRLGALISDKTITVSKEYIKEIVKRLGWDLEKHVDYVPNATTWSIEDILSKVLEIHPKLRTHLRSIDDAIDKRSVIRKYFLVEAISKLRGQEPIIDDAVFAEFMKNIDIPPFMEGGKPTSFKDDGPLVIVTGRLARQKGIHVLMNALEDIVYRVPNIRFVLLLLPVWGERELAEELIAKSIIFKDNIRVVFGKAPTIYYLAHIAANVMAAPSLYEPFGLMALEAMASGTPVVASKTGGLLETVIDILESGVAGTGIHVVPGDPSDLAGKLSDLVLFMETQYVKPWGKEWYSIIDRIEDKKLRDILLSNPEAPRKIRYSCITRSKMYTWDKSAEKALRIYLEQS